VGAIEPVRAESIADADLGFSLTVPPSFGDYPAGRRVPNTRCAYARGEPASGDFAIIGIEAMSGTFGGERLDPAALPAAAGIRFDLSRENSRSTRSPRGSRGTGELLRPLLVSLDGPSNWLSPAERLGPWIPVVLGAAALAGWGLLWSLRSRRRKRAAPNPPG
jgi:hypothetical protein